MQAEPPLFVHDRRERQLQVAGNAQGTPAATAAALDLAVTHAREPPRGTMRTRGAISQACGAFGLVALAPLGDGLT